MRNRRQRERVPHAEPLERRALLATFTVTNTDDAGPGSFRQAILDANDHPNDPGTRDLIDFDIPGSDVHTIAPISALPRIIEPVAIDGTSQPGFQGTPLIELSGAQVDGGSGLSIHYDLAHFDPEIGSLIVGLAINRFPGAGIDIAEIEGLTSSAPVNVPNIVAVNAIGTDPTGTIPLGNNVGMTVATAGSTIQGNLISGNRGDGLVLMTRGAFPGASIWADNAIIRGNRIGTDWLGAQPLGNGGIGIRISGSSNVTIGGTTAGEGNIIAANGSAGILLEAQVGHLGDSFLPTNTQIQGNRIGTNWSGDLDLGNARDGIVLRGSRLALIGGIEAPGYGPGSFPGNIIAYNGRAGVAVERTSPALFGGNAIWGNSIHSNVGLGIDLDPPNAVEPVVMPPVPTLSAALTSPGTTTVIGRLFGEPVASYRIELFGNPAGGSNGEGWYFIGRQDLTTDPGGDLDFTITVPDELPTTWSVTATATRLGNAEDDRGNTSEFSTPEPVTLPDRTAPVVVGLTRLGVHLQPTRIVIAFSEPMNRPRAENLQNYRLVWPGRDGRIGSVDDRPLPLRAASYDAATQSVILSPRFRLPLHRTYGLIVNGHPPDGLTDLSGNLLDGAGDGQPGTDYVARLGPPPRHNAIPTGPHARRAELAAWLASRREQRDEWLLARFRYSTADLPALRSH